MLGGSIRSRFISKTLVSPKGVIFVDRKNKQKEIMELLDRHPEMYDQILQLLRENVSDPEATQEPHQGAD